MDLKKVVKKDICMIGMITYIAEEFDVFLKKELKKRKIPILPKHAGLFIVLYSNDYRMEFKELAEVWRKSTSTLCDVVARYEKERLLEKLPAVINKKSIIVGLTSDALKYEKDFNEIGKIFIENMTSTISQDQSENFKFVLTEMMKSFI